MVPASRPHRTPTPSGPDQTPVLIRPPDAPRPEPSMLLLPLGRGHGWPGEPVKPRGPPVRRASAPVAFAWPVRVAASRTDTPPTAVRMLCRRSIVPKHRRSRFKILKTSIHRGPCRGRQQQVESKAVRGLWEVTFVQQRADLPAGFSGTPTCLLTVTPLHSDALEQDFTAQEFEQGNFFPRRHYLIEK